MTSRSLLHGVAGGAAPTPEMGSNPAAGLTCRPKGASNAPETVSERCRYQSESDIGPTVKSLSRLCSRDEEERAAALEDLSQGVLTRLEPDRPGPARLEKDTLLHLLRLSRSCPLPEVRERAAELLRTAQVRRGREGSTPKKKKKPTQICHFVTTTSIVVLTQDHNHQDKWFGLDKITTFTIGLHQPIRTF